MEENTDSNMEEEQPLPERKEGNKKCFHLFNCDKTYKLDVVEKLLNAIKDKLSFEISILTKKYFALSEMTELCKTIQSEPPMDFAVFVVHAHESRLSINEDNAGISYARFYRALLEKTGNKVIVVIGGDDNYKNAAEEEKAVLSRWTKRQISSQFKEEFVDGRISFIFSWDKEHRLIHEEAMLHFLDPGKKGEKFEPKLQPSKPAVDTIQEVTSNDVKATTPINYSNLDLEPVKDDSIEMQRAETNGRQENIPVYQSLNSEKSNLVETVQVTPEIRRGQYAEPTTEGTFSKRLKAMAEDTPSQGKVAVVCRDQSDVAIITDWFGDELLDIFNIYSGSPYAGLSYLLSIISMRSCIIVVDAGAMKDELCRRSAETPYTDLLNTIRETVVRKVVIIVCSDDSEMSQDEEDALTREVRLHLGEKGEILWRKGNKNPLHQTQKPKRPLQYRRSQSLPERDGMAERSQTRIAKRPMNPSESTLLLKARLRDGIISYQDEEGWKPPKEIEDDLMRKWRSTADAELLIYQENTVGRYRVVVNKESFISQVGDSLKETFFGNSGTGCLSTLGKRERHLPKDTADHMEPD
ncbi:uncharacterized protein LOC110044214 isoform X2 [Orbicella faveolata]|uniref:uncharacterized protein LOC110044214 isoform X2 n=1 Tax=Orbicella faveolata TaxID=48498 RepID=UPI0009E58989|nr:uncharacterized protein LOC110044214 isoform X2 [Orbicella faveolata]